MRANKVERKMKRQRYRMPKTNEAVARGDHMASLYGILLVKVRCSKPFFTFDGELYINMRPA